MTLLALRSALFHLAFYLNMAAFMLVCAPVFVLPRRAGLVCMHAWAATTSWLLAAICGLRFEIRGARHLPRGAALVASKHQSAWETMAFLHIFPDPAMVLKRELLWLPVFGWYAMKFGHLPIDRTGGTSALKRLLGHARTAAADGRQVVIFPEGTRRAPGAPPAYLRGVAALYRDLKLPCVPVALDSGRYWPRRNWLRRPGTIVVEFLEPIPPGLDGKAFMAELQTRIEGAVSRLDAAAAPVRGRAPESCTPESRAPESLPPDPNA